MLAPCTVEEPFENAEGTNGCAFKSEEIPLLETAASVVGVLSGSLVWVSLAAASCWVGDVDTDAVKVACVVTALDFPGVTPPHALSDALCAAATAAGTNAGADTGSLLFLIAAAQMQTAN